MEPRPHARAGSVRNRPGPSAEPAAELAAEPAGHARGTSKEPAKPAISQIAEPATAPNAPHAVVSESEVERSFTTTVKQGISMATEMTIPLTFRGRQWNSHIGDTLMVLTPFANHALTTMMLQMKCWVCGILEKAKVTRIDSMDDWVTATVPRLVHRAGWQPWFIIGKPVA